MTRRLVGRDACAVVRCAPAVLAAALTGCVSTEAPRKLDGAKLEAAVLDRPERGAPTRGPLAWGLDGGGAAAAPQQPQDPANETPAQRDARLRVQFGSNVMIGADGLVTKQYFLAGDLAQTFQKLITDVPTQQSTLFETDRKPPMVPAAGTKIGGAANRSVLGRMLRDHEIEVTFVPEFEILSGVRLVDVPGQPPAVLGDPLDNKYKSAPAVGLALVTAKASALAAFEAAMDLLYTNIPQVEITVLVVEYQAADALAFGVTAIDNATPLLTNLSSSQLVRAYSSEFPLRAPTVGASPVTDIARFTLGGIHDSWELNMVLEALEANNLADIQSSPKLVVRNGGIASVSTLTQFPFPKAKYIQLGNEVATEIEFKPVGVKMNIVPMIAGTDSVILQIYADVSAITAFAPTLPVSTPIVSTRSAVTTVYLKDEHTLVIGGLQSETKFESETKVPILGDIPLLGFLFRSTSQTRNKTNVEFHISARIVKDRGTPRETSSF